MTRSPNASPTAARWSPPAWHALLIALTLATLLIHGFHPLAEDGGVYIAGVEWKLDPTLFPHYNEFVREHLRFSLFAPALAALVHLTHLSLLYVLFLVELFSLWLSFFAARLLMQRLIADDRAQLTALALLSAWWTLPVAGTSLLLMDPYVTGRNLTLPLSLLAIAFSLDDWRSTKRSALLCILCLTLAAASHPLMAGYAIAFVILIRALQLPRPTLALFITAFVAVLLAAALQACAPHETPAARVAALSRDYWYLHRWQWYEWTGLIVPPLLLLYLVGTPDFHPRARLLARAAAALGAIAMLIAFVFAREGYSSHLVARLQPLRVYVMIYALMALTIGAAATVAANSKPLRSHIASLLLRCAPGTFVLAMAALMFAIQRDTFRAGQHLELPWRIERNPSPWAQAFRWARDNTPRDALFALDAKYVNTPGEDCETFRATALRSALPDYSKDGGEASITPALAEAWLATSAAQKDLSRLDDAERDARLAPFHPTWMVLHTDANTAHTCPYRNDVVKVCRVTE